MARSVYLAPGVYVEEVPSARQQIAGVGTNTVGFIGIVPDEIYIPRVSSKFDPTLATNMMNVGSTGADQAKLRAVLRARSAQMGREIDSLKKLIADERGGKAAPAAAATAAAGEKPKEGEGPKEAAAPAAAPGRALVSTAQLTRQADLDSLTADQKLIDVKLAELVNPPAPAKAAAARGAAAAASAPAPFEDITENEEAGNYENSATSDEYKSPSRTRPYWLEKFTVVPKEFETKFCTNFAEYASLFGSHSAFNTDPGGGTDEHGQPVYSPMFPGHHFLTHAVDGFFRNGGTKCFVARVKSAADLERALEHFSSIDDVSIIAAPGLPKTVDTWEALESYAESPANQNVFAILDPPAVVSGTGAMFNPQDLQIDADKGFAPRRCSYAAFYFPQIAVADPAKQLQDADPARNINPKYRGRAYVAPSGHIAGIYARTDEERGVHKAPANAGVRGAVGVRYYVSRAKQELLNPDGINCLREILGEVKVWGARTHGGDSNGEFRYINVRRFMGFLEESLDEGTQWVVFEPNDPSLWSKITFNVEAFLTNVRRSGALLGSTSQEAFYVKCDAELNPPEMREAGIVMTEIGVAIVRPAEFVVFRIGQTTGLPG